jgi:hypothetical protein
LRTFGSEFVSWNWPRRNQSSELLDTATSVVLAFGCGSNNAAKPLNARKLATNPWLVEQARSAKDERAARKWSTE